LSGSIIVVAASQLPTAAPTSTARSGDVGSFGNVLSTKLSGQAADKQGSSPSSPRTSATTPAKVSSKNPGTGKARDEKRHGEDNALAPTAFPAEILPTQRFRSAMQGTLATSNNSGNPNNSSSQVFASGDGAKADALASAKLAPSTDAQRAAPPQQLTSVTNPSSGAQAREPIRSTSPIDKQDTAAEGDAQSPSFQSAGGDQRVSALPFVSVAASAQVQPTNEVPATGTTILTSLTVPNAVPSGTSQPEATQQHFEWWPEGKSTQALEDAAAATGAPGPAAFAVETEAKLPQGPALPAIDVTASKVGAAPKRSSDGPNRTQRKQDASGSKPPQPASNARSDAPPQPSGMGDSPSPKAHELTQTTPATLIHNDQDKPAMPAGTALPVAGRAAASAPNAKDAGPQAVSTAPSPAENAEPASLLTQSARVLERMGQAEMRLGLNSKSFGSIELHTIVNQDRVGASIATSHTELRAAMMAEMPSLERAIAQHQLRLDSVNVDSGPGAQTGNSGAFGGNSSGSRSWTQSAAKISECSEDTTAQEVSLPQTWMAPHSSGLNVHA